MPEESGANPSTFHEWQIEPRHGWVGVDFRELWDARELLFFLVQRELKVRYKQTALGLAWAVLVPLANMAILTVVFGRVAGFGSRLPDAYEGSYASYVYAALLPWTVFSNSMLLGGMSLVNQQHLMTKVYFPRMFVPAAVVGASIVDMFVSSVFFVAMALATHTPLFGALWLLPVGFVMLVSSALGAALLLSALTVRYRDFRFAVPFLSQFLMWATPVGFPMALFSSRQSQWVALNPMTGVIEAFRAALLGTPSNPAVVLISAAVSVVLLLVGVAYFRRTEAVFADLA